MTRATERPIQMKGNKKKILQVYMHIICIVQNITKITSNMQGKYYERNQTKKQKN